MVEVDPGAFFVHPFDQKTWSQTFFSLAVCPNKLERLSLTGLIFASRAGSQPNSN